MISSIRDIFLPTKVPVAKLLSEYVFLSNRSDREQQRFEEYINDLAKRFSVSAYTFLLITVIVTWPTDYIYLENENLIDAYEKWRSLFIIFMLVVLIGRYITDLIDEYFIGFGLIGAIGITFITALIFGRVTRFNQVWFSVIFALPFISVPLPINLKLRTAFTFGLPSVWFLGFWVHNYDQSVRAYTGIQFNLACVLTLGSIILGHYVYAIFRQNFFQSQDLEQEREKSEKLLTNILPEEISERLKAGEDVSEKFDEVTVLFADIVEFTPIADHYEADEVVSILDEMFSSFDDLVNEYGLEKIKTIGDEYFVAAGVPERIDKPALRMANLAIDMKNEVQNHQRHDGSPFRLRCGMNTGPLVAGIIGKEKFVYDVWGDTVNIGSRMESQGEPGKIQVTPSTKKRIEEQDDNSEFQFEERGAIDVKGKGKMNTYFIQDHL